MELKNAGKLFKKEYKIIIVIMDNASISNNSQITKQIKKIEDYLNNRWHIWETRATSNAIEHILVKDGEIELV